MGKKLGIYDLGLVILDLRFFCVYIFFLFYGIWISLRVILVFLWAIGCVWPVFVIRVILGAIGFLYTRFVLYFVVII